MIPFISEILIFFEHSKRVRFPENCIFQLQGFQDKTQFSNPVCNKRKKENDLICHRNTLFYLYLLSYYDFIIILFNFS